MKKLLQFFAVISLLAVTVFATSQVNAQSTGLGINPRVNHTVNAGESVSGTLFVSNLNEDVALTVDVNVIDFKSSGEDGTPALQLDENAPQTAWSLKPFITLPESVKLKPGESTYIDYTIRIPEKQGAGSYYSAIQYAATAEGSGQVVLNAAPATLAFVTVPGRATELLTLQQFGTYEPNNSASGKFRSFFVTESPKMMAYRLQNAGTVAEDPKGAILIKNLFGKTVATIENANPKSNLALIDQTRRFEVCIKGGEHELTDEETGVSTTVDQCEDPKLAPGIYTADLSLFYGINGSNTQEIAARAVFWYFPVWFIAVIVAILAIIAAGIVWLRKKLVGNKVKSRRR